MKNLEIEDFIKELKNQIAIILEAEDDSFITINSGMSLASISNNYELDSLDQISILVGLEKELEVDIPYNYEWNKNKSVKTLYLDFCNFR